MKDQDHAPKAHHSGWLGRSPETWQSLLGTHAALLVGGSAATLAVLIHSWPIACAGVATSAALWGADRWKARPRPPAPRAPDPQTDTVMAALEGARAELDRTLAATEPSLRADLAPLVGPIDDLVRRASGLAARSAEIGAYLQKHDVAVLRRECEALAARAAQTSDEAVREQILAARATRVGHTKTLVELAAVKERIGATLLSIVAAVEALAPKIVKLRGLSGAEDATRDVERELSAMTEELTAFEQVLVQVNQEVTS